MAKANIATLYRIVLPDHICPFGVRARQMLEEAGYAIDDRILTSRAQVDAFETEHGVDTTPQVFIDDQRIGGCDDLGRFLRRNTRATGSDGSLSPLAALGVVAAVLGASAIPALRNAPDPLHPRIRRWYHRLDKPGFTPPDPVFGAVWPVLECGLGVGAYRLLRQPASAPRNAAVGLWLLNIGMVGGWTELFFRQKRLGASTVASATMLATSTAYVAAAAKVDRPAALVGVPFVAWIGFATLLAERVWQKNRPGMADRAV